MKCIYACSSFHDYLSRCVGIVAKFPKWSKIATLCVTLCYLSIHRHTTISSRVSGIMGGGVAWGHSQTHYYILRCEWYYGWRGCLGIFTDTLLYPHMWAILWMAGLPGYIHIHTTIPSHVSGTMGGGVAWGHSQTHYYFLTCERYYGWRGCLETRYLKLLVIACNILCNRYMVYNSSEQVDSTMTPNLCITKYILLMRVYAIHVVQFIY